MRFIKIPVENSGNEPVCESCYFENVCAQTEFVPGDITECERGSYVWALADDSECMYTYKIWDKKKEVYVRNNTAYGKRAPYDCFPKKSVNKIASRLLGQGNFETHKFKLIREE